MNRNILYLSYDGMLEPLGASQVLGYLKGMSKDQGVQFTLISFEKPKDMANSAEKARMMREIADAGIDWIPLKYHKKPPLLSTLWDSFQMTTCALRVCSKKKINIVHARSYVSSLTGLILKKVFGVRFVFDMRGFWADERADSGQWARSSLIYKTIKKLEEKFILSADAIVSLTYAGVNEMKRFPYLQKLESEDGCSPSFYVIPTCANLDFFNFARVTPKSKSGFTLAHVGSIGFWYDFSKAVDVFIALRIKIPDANFLILNRGEHLEIVRILKLKGIPEDHYRIVDVPHREMAETLAEVQGAVFFIKPLYSKIASAPTKLAELWGMGIPCIVGGGVGDMDQFFEDQRVGVALRADKNKSLSGAVDQIIALSGDPETKKHCRELALRHFSVAEGTKRYLEIYRKILPSHH